MALVVESLAQTLHRSRAPVVVLELLDDGWWPRLRRGTAGETILAVCVRDPGVVRSFGRRLTALIRRAVAEIAIRRIVRRHGLRVAHFHYAFPEYDLVRRIVQRAHLPIVSTFHGNDLGANMNHPRTRTTITHLLDAAAVVTTVSDALRRRLINQFPATASIARTIPNAVPASFAGRSAMNDDARDVDVLFVGNLIPRKGVDVLLRALAIVHERRPTLSAVIAGEGPEREALAACAAELGLTGVVQFVGHQGRDAVVALYRRARVAAVPSRAEPFGLVVVEAMVGGAAVVANNVGGIPEIAAQTGGVILVPPDDPHALAAAIIGLLDDPVRRDRVAAETRDRALRYFAPEAIRDAYVAAYRAALGMDAARAHG